MGECLRRPQPKSQKDVPTVCVAMQKCKRWTWMDGPRAILMRSWCVVIRIRSHLLNIQQLRTSCYFSTNCPMALQICEYTIMITCLDHEDMYFTRLCRSVHLWEVVSEVRSTRRIAWQMSACNCLMLIYSWKRAIWDWCQVQLLNEWCRWRQNMLCWEVHTVRHQHRWHHMTTWPSRLEWWATEAPSH